MDADHGGRADGERKPAWPEVTSPPDVGLHGSGGGAEPGAPHAGPHGAGPSRSQGTGAADGTARGAAETAAPDRRAPNGGPASPEDAEDAETPEPPEEGETPKVPEPPKDAETPRTRGTEPDPPGPADGAAPAQLDGATLPPAPAPGARGSDTPSTELREGAGIAGLSLPYQVVAALALSVFGLLACGQLAMVFLHVAPSNTLTKQHGEAFDDWIYPEFEQNWKLFAPNPLQQNVAVEARADVEGADGRRTTRWVNLSREDGEAIRGSLLPSHVHQNELRRAWDFYTGSHTEENRPNGLRGELSERYMRRIVMLRLSRQEYGGTIERVQIRSAVTAVGAPAWSDEKISTEPVYRALPWWNVTDDDLPEGSGQGQASAGAEGAE
ncbi:DUF5819 family protein [Streptomyces halstedii]|uniref:DUF5819 family protein n=1 Tax=Streptomyces halstedii TaxID=1944 RepID=UPI000490E140